MSTPQERLIGGFYNSAAWSGANPGGLANGGHVQNFPAALEDIGIVAQDVGAKAAQTVGAANAAGSSAASAAEDRRRAEQAAAAAAAFDPSTKVNKVGDTMTGPLAVKGSGVSGTVQLEGYADPLRSGSVVFKTSAGVRTSYVGAADETWNYLSAENGRGWYIQGQVSLNGVAPWTSANDGSGSGLDADLLRGMGVSSSATGNTVVVRNGSGDFETRRIGLSGADAQLYFTANGKAFTPFQTDGARLNGQLYLDGAVSASVVTERSDRNLKRDIVTLSVPAGRLRPVSFRLRETDELRVGFIAQEVAEVQPLAVTYPEEGAMEVRLMGVIAHLAAQLNDALDRIEQLEKR